MKTKTIFVYHARRSGTLRRAWSSLVLWLNGIPNIGIHPFLIHGSKTLYNVGIYNILAGQLTSYPHY
jgi:hypothetical protein